MNIWTRTIMERKHLENDHSEKKNLKIVKGNIWKQDNYEKENSENAVL